MSTHVAGRRLTQLDLARMRADGEKIAVLTCYDASFAQLCDAAGVDALLIGDSLGMVLQGHDSTLPVTLTDVAYHTAVSYTHLDVYKRQGHLRCFYILPSFHVSTFYCVS